MPQHVDPDISEEVEEIIIPEEELSSTEIEPDYQEKWQRAMAELENFRRRTEAEKLELAKYAIKSLVEDLIPVVDNFYRATEHIPAEQQGSPWVAGIGYIQKNLLDALEARGVKEITAKDGDHFDASKHEAIQNPETDQSELEDTIKIINRGYMLHDRVLRPVQVAVYSTNNK